MRRLVPPAVCLIVAAVSLGSVTACGGSPQRPAFGAAGSQDPLPGTAIATESLFHRADVTRQVRLSAVGDMILGSTPNVPSNPYAYLSPVRRAVRWTAGVVFANLEGTLTTETHSKCNTNSSTSAMASTDATAGTGATTSTGTANRPTDTDREDNDAPDTDRRNTGRHARRTSTCYAFRNPPTFARAFRRTGFTVLNDANNHSHDFGQAGLDQTVPTIRHAGMVQTGLPGEISYVKTGGVRVGLVAFAPYPNTADLLDLPTARRMIHTAGRHADLVVVYMHAGAEGSDRQHVTGHEEHYLGEDRGNPEKFAHLAIRAGADLVIASGPHVLRGMEFYRHRLIAYSLGNFANFHNFAGGGVLSDSAILHVTLTANGRYVSGRLVPVTLQSGGRALRGGDSVSVVRRLSHQDFPVSRARFGGNGRITPPG